VSDAHPGSWLREPLVHFLAIGVALFALYGLVNDDVDGADNRIEITDGTIARLTDTWTKTWQRSPTDAELRNLIDGHIREEVLVREALALGLDTDDVIIRRRLAQKMEFLAEDLSRLTEPQDAELKRFFAANPELFREPARLSFRQIYFNADRRGATVAAEAETLLTALRAGEPVDLDSSGDRFMLDLNYELATEREVARAFGTRFAAALFATASNGWHGPLESGYGLHVVLVDARKPARLPEFSSVRKAVYTAWMDVEQRRMEQEIFERLKSRYEIVFTTTDGPPT